jgi:hypothetical protein
LNLPKKIKFGHRNITVEYTDKLWYDQQITADVSIDSCTIQIDSSVAKSVQKRSLFLNLLYIAFATHQLCDGAIDDLESLMLALFAVFRDNPDLLVFSAVREIRSLRIMGSEFNLTTADDVTYEGKACINYLHEYIHYPTVGSDDRVYQSIIHEVIHAIVQTLALNKPSHPDVHRMAWLISMLFHQNDFSWLLEDEDES